MSYTPTEWQTGDTITAAGLNKMERGISDASSGGGAALFVNVTYDSQQYEWTPDKTYAEVAAALAAGTPVFISGIADPNNYTPPGGVYDYDGQYSLPPAVARISNGIIYWQSFWITYNVDVERNMYHYAGFTWTSADGVGCTPYEWYLSYDPV